MSDSIDINSEHQIQFLLRALTAFVSCVTELNLGGIFAKLEFF